MIVKQNGEISEDQRQSVFHFLFLQTQEMWQSDYDDISQAGLLEVEFIMHGWGILFHLITCSGRNVDLLQSTACIEFALFHPLSSIYPSIHSHPISGCQLSIRHFGVRWDVFRNNDIARDCVWLVQAECSDNLEEDKSTSTKRSIWWGEIIIDAVWKVGDVVLWGVGGK